MKIHHTKNNIFNIKYASKYRRRKKHIVELSESKNVYV